MERVRLGIIGLGGMGAVHRRYIADGMVPRLEVTAVCDRDPGTFPADPAIATFNDSGALIRSGLVDAILVATPHYAHTAIGMDALQAGLHVLVEKPISVHKADCERLLAAHAGREGEQVFAAMFNQRTTPSTNASARSSRRANWASYGA